MDSIFSEFSPEFCHFWVHTLIRLFFGTHLDNFLILARILHFQGTHPDSSIFRCLHCFDPFPVLVGIVFLILKRILPFPGTRSDSKISNIFRYPHWFDLIRYSPWQFFDTRTDSTFSQYSPGFYHFSVLILIRPYFGTCLDRFSILARILPFPSTRLDSTIFRHSHWFDPFLALARTVFRCSNGFYLFRVLTQTVFR